MKRDYPRLSVTEFSRQLIETGDLDPVYIALRGVPWHVNQVKRWCVAYWCLYHCGAASYISEAQNDEFWIRLHDAAKNWTSPPPGGRWPRGHERRHFRGIKASQAVAELATRYTKPEFMVDGICQEAPSFENISKLVQEHRLFGPWIAFKIADMVDRVFGCPVNVENAHVFMFKDPVKGAHLVLEHNQIESGETDPIKKAVGFMKNAALIGMQAPPLNDRPVGILEIETCLCKYKSHLNGHYPVGNDLQEIKAGLVGWGDAAQDFAGAMP